MKTGVKLFFSFLIMSIFSSVFALDLFAGEERDYAWLTLQSGVAKFNQKQYGDAMVLFSKCEELTPSDADTHYWIGRVYQVEGDYQLAKLEYLKAISYYQFETPFTIDQIYETSLHLCEVYSFLGEKENYIATLDSLLTQSSSKSNKERERLYSSLLNSFNQGGLNKVLELYRIESSFESEVFTKKAFFYKDGGDLNGAKLNFMLSVVSILTTVLNECEENDISFIFTNQDNAADGSVENITSQKDVASLYTTVYSDLSDLLKDVAREKLYRDYIANSNLMENIYQFAEVLSLEGEKQKAIDLLWLCIKYPYNKNVSKSANRLFATISRS